MCELRRTLLWLAGRTYSIGWRTGLKRFGNLTNNVGNSKEWVVNMSSCYVLDEGGSLAWIAGSSDVLGVM